MKRRLFGIIVMVLVVLLFVTSAVAVTYSGSDTYINTTYVKTAVAGTTTLVASGNENNANTVGANSGSAKVMYVWLFKYNPETGSYENIYDAKLVNQGYSLTVSLSRDKTEKCYYQHIVKKYNTTSTVGYSSKPVIDSLEYVAYQYNK